MKRFYIIRILFILVIAYMIYVVSGNIYVLHKVGDAYVYKCADFERQIEAQRKFNTGNKQYSRLDGNKDGIACNLKKELEDNLNI